MLNLLFVYLTLTIYSKLIIDKIDHYVCCIYNIVI